MKRTLIYLSALVALAVGAPVLAQTAAAPPKHNCARPEEFPGRLASDLKLRSWQRAYLAYTDCLKQFIAEQQAIAEPHIKAGNAAIAEYNSATKEFNAAIEAAKENVSKDAPQ